MPHSVRNRTWQRLTHLAALTAITFVPLSVPASAAAASPRSAHIRKALLSTHEYLALCPSGPSGYYADGTGLLTPFGGAPAITDEAIWGTDVVRGIVLRPDCRSGYTLDYEGAVHPFGGAPPVAITKYYPGGDDIMRGIVLRSDGVSGYVLDGYGNLWPFGGAPAVTTTGNWNYDIARAVVLEPNGDSGYVIDACGGIQPFGPVGGPTAPNNVQGQPGSYVCPPNSSSEIVGAVLAAGPSGSGVFPPNSGYMMSRDGALWGFGSSLPPAVSTRNYFGSPSGTTPQQPCYNPSNLEFGAAFSAALGTGACVGTDGSLHFFGGPTQAGAVGSPALTQYRAIAYCPGTSMGYYLDGNGNLYPFGGAPLVSNETIWQGWDIARGLVLRSDCAGYVLSGWGGLYPFSPTGVDVPPAITMSPGSTWNNWDFARAVVLLSPDPSVQPSGYVLDGYGGIHPFGNAPALTGTPYWPGSDIARGLVLDANGTSGYVLDGWGGVHAFGGAPVACPSGYWPGWDIARGIVLRGDGDSGYVLDGLGGTHPWGPCGSPAPTILPASAGGYWGVDTGAGAIALREGSDGSLDALTLDAFGRMFSYHLGSPGSCSLPPAVSQVNVIPRDGAARLSWQTEQGATGCAVTSYSITPTAGSTVLPTLKVAASEAPSQYFTVPNLVNGETYTFTIAAANSGGVGPDSAATSPTTIGLPEPPYDLFAAAGNASAFVNWTGPDVAGASQITGYLITPYQNGTAGAPSISWGPSTHASVCGLTDKLTYTFRVQAMNVFGIDATGATTTAPVTPLSSLPSCGTVGLGGVGSSAADLGSRIALAAGRLAEIVGLGGRTDAVKPKVKVAVSGLTRGAAAVGGTVTYMASISTDSSTATNVTFTDQLPSGVSGAEAVVKIGGRDCPAADRCSASEGMISVTSLPVGAGTTTVSYAVTLTGPGSRPATVSDFATVTSASGTSAHASAGFVEEDGGLGLAKWWSVTTQKLGDSGTAQVNASDDNLTIT